MEVMATPGGFPSLTFCSLRGLTQSIYTYRENPNSGSQRWSIHVLGREKDTVAHPRCRRNFARFKQTFPGASDINSFSYCLAQEANTPISSGIGSREARDAICVHILATRGDGNK